MSAWVDQSLARPRFAMSLLTAFAGLALVLATLGIYGVMAFLVSQSTREIGIRIALGATQRAILGLVVRQGLALALSGAVVGLLAALALNRLLASLLFGVGVTDVAAFTLALLLLCASAFLATYIPARRAARIDPVESLRME
jgi:ABC-type antimicrobial peptide transport system permease subunit